MIKRSISLQDLRRRIYIKAKAEKTWRFWGLYVHIHKRETLREAYKLARRNNGSAGIDGIGFADIEAAGVDEFLSQISNDLATRNYRPQRVKNVQIPKPGNKVRILSIPTIRDRVVQGALKLILEPIFEADFQPGSYGYRPKRTAHQAVYRVAEAIAQGKTRVIDIDLSSYFDNVRHHILMEKIAERVSDDDVMRLLKLILKATGKKGVPQGGVISPLLSNIYLNEVDRMLERAQEVTRYKRYTSIEYVRYADDLLVLIDWHSRNDWLQQAVMKRLEEEFAKIKVEINAEKSRTVNLAKGETFGFLGFTFKRVRSRKGKWRPLTIPQIEKRTALIRKLKDIFRRFKSQPVQWVINCINPILRGWVNYFAIGSSSRCFQYVRQWVMRKVRRHLMRARMRHGFGWKRWSNQWIYEKLGLFDDYRVKYRGLLLKALPAG
jgi:RNA-directed DNA polymerase